MDEYPDKYYNYNPVKILGYSSYPANKTSEFWKRETIAVTPYSQVWDLNNNSIAFGLRLTNKNFFLHRH